MKKRTNAIKQVYDKLLETYSYQGWWPLFNLKEKNMVKSYLNENNLENNIENNIENKKNENEKNENEKIINGYHPKDYSYPKTEIEQFEIILGTILTQNTNWTSVEKSINNLNKLTGKTNAENILKIAKNKENDFKEAIKSSRYANQKYNYIINISNFYINLNGRTPKRSELLEVKGVGNETADSILLYGYKKGEFVVDAYTRRIFEFLGHINKKDSYAKVKELFESNLKNNYKVFQEYHGLIVEHGKNYYSKKPYASKDRVLNEFKLK
ncbi:MAG: endonuclease III domain-containing protein [Methanobrevibacter sp.]|jgi:endonuclease-3 related protein|nr:endonuclease III domain-containing protein [Methanobrevibacter sp.]